MLLNHLTVVELETTLATGYAGHLLSELGASVTVVESGHDSALSLAPPFVGDASATAAYLSEGKDRRVVGEPGADALVAEANVVLTAGAEPPDAWGEVIARAPLPRAGRVIAACTAYGLTGPKREWSGSELTLFQAGGEGKLQLSGLALSEAPERPPLGGARNQASYTAGITVALAALGALRTSRRTGTTELADISMQDSQLSLSYLTVSRYVEGFLEDRWNRSLRYGGVLRCRDGYIELIPIEEHQWGGVRSMLGDPEWARDERFATGMDRTQHGEEINERLRAWAVTQLVADVVAAAKEHSVPCGPYVEPRTLPASPQLQSRGFFRSWDGPDALAPLFPGTAWGIDE